MQDVHGLHVCTQKLRNDCSTGTTSIARRTTSTLCLVTYVTCSVAIGGLIFCHPPQTVCLKGSFLTKHIAPSGMRELPHSISESMASFYNISMPDLPMPQATIGRMKLQQYHCHGLFSGICSPLAHLGLVVSALQAYYYILPSHLHIAYMRDFRPSQHHKQDSHPAQAHVASWCHNARLLG